MSIHSEVWESSLEHSKPNLKVSFHHMVSALKSRPFYSWYKKQMLNLDKLRDLNNKNQVETRHKKHIMRIITRNPHSIYDFVNQEDPISHYSNKEYLLEEALTIELIMSTVLSIIDTIIIVIIPRV